MLALFAPLGSFSAAERQSFANAIRTVHTVRAWSPAHHRYFPRSDRAEIVDTLLALRRSGLPNDVIVGHVLPSTFAPPWAETEEERHERHQQRFFEERQRARALLQG